MGNRLSEFFDAKNWMVIQMIPHLGYLLDWYDGAASETLLVRTHFGLANYE